MTVTPSRYLPAEYEPDPIDVTDVRKTLIAESYEHFEVVKRIASKAVATKGMTDDEADLVEASSAVADYAYLLAGLLRIIEDKHGPDEARKMAELFDMVREHGTEVLADVNSDLDEKARDAEPTSEAVETTEPPARPEIDVTLGAPVQIYYEFPDPFTGQVSGRRVPCHIVNVDGDWFRVRPDRLGRGSTGNEFTFRTGTFEAHHNNFGWHVEAVDAR